MDYYRARPNRTAIANRSQQHRTGPDPAIRADTDCLEYALFRPHDPAFGIPGMLVLSAQYLHS